MILKNTLRITSAFILILPSLLNAAPCSETIKRINTDINKYPNSLHDNQFPWMSLHWLQQHLGRPQISTTAEKQTQYKWNCPENSDVSLIVVTSQSGKLNSVSGEYSSEQESDAFSADVKRPDITVKPNNQLSTASQQITSSNLPTETKVVVIDTKSINKPDLTVDNVTLKIASQQIIQSFNQWFNVQITNDQQAEELGVNKITAYFSKLRSCTPGTYQYPVLDPMAAYQTDQTKPIQLFRLETSTISGYKNGICVVNSSVTSNAESAKTICNYSPTSLSLFTDELAKSFYQMGELALAENSATRQVMSECKKLSTAQDAAEQTSLLAYISKFKSCTPGTYTNSRGPGKVVTVISGYQNNKCILQGTLYFGNSQQVINCAYSQESLNVLADTKIEALNGTSTKNPQAASPEFINATQKAFKECDHTWLPL